jgi:hypothetical protein
MEIEMIYRLAIPIILIGIGIWLRSLKEENSKGMKKYSLFFIIGGVILLALRLYKYFGI